MEQRKNFNPIKNLKALKLTEGLQAENKSLKKKFQMVFTELTKNYKTIELFRAKVAEYEQ